MKLDKLIQSDIKDAIETQKKKAEENDLIQIAYKMTENTLLMKQAGDKAINKINELQKQLDFMIDKNDEKQDIINKQKEVLDKIKEKCKEEKEVHFNNGTIINGLAIYILELLEEIE